MQIGPENNDSENNDEVKCDPIQEARAKFNEFLARPDTIPSQDGLEYWEWH